MFFTEKASCYIVISVCLYSIQHFLLSCLSVLWLLQCNVLSLIIFGTQRITLFKTDACVQYLLVKTCVLKAQSAMLTPIYIASFLLTLQLKVTSEILLQGDLKKKENQEFIWCLVPSRLFLLQQLWGKGIVLSSGNIIITQLLPDDPCHCITKLP